MRSAPAHFRRPFPDTPCARCGHHHAGAVEFCGEWVSHWSWERAEFYRCVCPEWAQPPHRCACGLTSLTPFPAYLNGARACSADCAALIDIRGKR